jgi:hypothetical protein
VARIHGEPSSPARARGDALVSPWGGPTASFGVQVEPVVGFVLELTAEAGFAVAPVNALVDGSREVTMKGLWGGVALGMGGRF